MHQLAQAQPLPDGTRLLHIGLPKAGSTALQGALHAARPLLAQHDILLAGRTQHPYAAAAVAAGHRRPWYTSRETRSWERIAAELRASTDRVSVLSSEALSRADREHAQQVCACVADAADQVHVSIVARPLARVLPSVWQQALRGFGAPAFDEWLKEVTADPADNKVAARFIRRFDLPRQIRDWSSAVGEDHVTVVVLDPADRGHLLDSFDRLLGLPPGTLQPQPKLTNESLPYPEAEMLRLVQQRFFDEGGTHQEWLRRVMRWIRSDVRDLRSPGPDDRIQPPKWAVDAINEVTAPWVDMIRASGVTVVGDLGGLLADPAQYATVVDQPAVVPITSAAELTHYFYRAGYQEGERQSRQAERASAPAVASAQGAATAALSRPEVSETPTRELAREIGRRAARRVLRRQKSAGSATR